jgi:hypothetical protein
VAGVFLIVAVAIAWEIYRAFVRALFRLPHWVDILLLTVVGAAISYALLRFIRTMYSSIRKRPMSRNASLVVLVALVTLLVANLLTPSPSPPPDCGPTNSAIIAFPDSWAPFTSASLRLKAS